MMALGFNTMNNIQAYGDGEGNIVIEEWTTDAFEDSQNLIGRVRISVNRFELIANCVSELVSEAWHGVKE